MVYGSSDEFQAPPPQRMAEKQAAQAKLAQARQENIQVQQQRQQAPGNIKSGSPQDIAVRAEAAKAEQQRMVSENIQRIGTTSDRYSQAREEAIKSGSFSYGGFGKEIPQSFVTSKGQRIERQTLPMTQGRNIPTTPIMKTAVTPATERPTSDLSMVTTMKSTTTPPVIQISQAQLQKTNALRASQGLPPLETVTTVQIVSPTTKAPVSPEISTATLFGKTFTTFTPTSEKQTGEVSSFLKVPFAGQKATGGQVPSTSLADVFAFVPIGSLEKGAVSAGKELVGFFSKAFSKEAPEVATAAKAGTSDIGLNVPKYTEKFRTEKNIQSMISEKMKTPPPSMAREGKEVTPTTVEISLGRGTGKVISKEKGGTGILEGTGKPPTSPTEKTVSAGRGLEQIVKEKPVTKTVQRQKPEFEQKQLSKQEQFLKEQEKAKTEQTTKTEQQLKTKQEETLIQRTGLRYIKEPKPTQKETTAPLITIPKPRQTQRPRPQIFIPGFVPVTTTITKQKQTISNGFPMPTRTPTIPTLLIPTPPLRTPPPTTPPPPTKTPPTEQPPPDKKHPPPDLTTLGVGGLPGLIGKVSKGGFRREFVGNVPEASIIGTYKRSELSYSQRTISKSASEQSKQATGRFVQRKTSRIL